MSYWRRPHRRTVTNNHAIKIERRIENNMSSSTECYCAKLQSAGRGVSVGESEGLAGGHNGASVGEWAW